MVASRFGDGRRDLLLSYVGGPMRIVLPTAVLFVLYPWVLREHGLAVIGVWGLLSTFVSYGGLLDAGVSPLLVRELARGPDDVAVDRLARWRATASYVYAACAAVFALVALSVIMVLGAPRETGYSRAGLAITVVALAAGLVVHLLARLDLCLFRAQGRTYAEQWALSLSSAGGYAIGAGGLLVARPLEGLAVGFLVGSSGLLVWTRFAARRAFPALYSRYHIRRFAISSADVRSLWTHSRHLASLTAVFAVREPLFRLLLASAAGVSAVAVYELASRVPMLIREIGASGGQSLLGPLSRLGPAHEHTTELVRNSLTISLFLGGTGLAFFAVARVAVLEFWLGSITTELATAALIMAGWWALTLINVPFFWLLQALGREKDVARAVWLHVIGLVAATPLLLWSDASTLAWMLAYALSGLTTQIYLYGVVERTTGLTRRVVLDTRFLLAIGGAVAVVLVGVRLAPVASTLVSGPWLMFAATWLLAYLTVTTPLLLWASRLRLPMASS